MFVDTNAIDNKGSAIFFLGGRYDLEKISKKADIGIPRIVYDELCKHIATFLSGQLHSFKKNPHRHLLNIKDSDLDSINHRTIVDDLIKNESIKYQIVDLKDEIRAYKETYQHALAGTAPFETNGDKGFKDTLIAKTIDQFCETDPKREIFLLTNDGRLAEYFDESKVKVINGFQEFDLTYSEDKLAEEAVIDRIWDYMNEAGVVLSSKRAPDKQWSNIDGDMVGLFLEKEHGDIYVLVDTVAREPISFIGESLPLAIEGLEKVSSFQDAHSVITDVDYVLDYMSLEDIGTVAQIMLINEHVYGIGTDDDISQFAAKLFHALDDNGESKLAEEIKKKYELNLLTKKQLAELPF